MKILIPLLLSLFVISTACGNKNKPGSSLCTDAGCKKEKEFVCSLTTPELQLRKETVLAELKKAVQERKELPNGYAFRFVGNDTMVDQLTEFVKSERHCCAFFDFSLKVSDIESPAWLEITGPEGAKEVITTELGL